LKQEAEKLEQETQRQEEWENAKTCPKCAENVKKAATVCRFCGYDFIEESNGEPTAPPSPPPSAKALGLPPTDKWYDGEDDPEDT